MARVEIEETLSPVHVVRMKIQKVLPGAAALLFILIPLISSVLYLRKCSGIGF